MNASVKLQPELKKRKLTPKQLKQHSFSYGNAGEKLALAYLAKQGYKLVACNQRINTIEIDIIAIEQITQASHNFSELVFCEVKRRKNNTFGRPETAVNWRKRHKMVTAASMLCQRYKWQHGYRFDIISITGDNLEHFKNITWLP